jgi:hypothetical protein
MLFVELPARYLTRAENGRILGLDQWPVQDSLDGWEIPLADHVHFVMEPLYDDGRSYYLMFELTDLQGDRLCSEPFELAVQPAPPAPEPTYTGLEWQEGQGAALELQGVSLRFDYGRSPENGKRIFTVTAVNGTASTVTVHLSDPSVNGVTGDPFPMGLELEPGQTQCSEYRSLETLLNLTGSTGGIRFFVSMEDSGNYATLCRDLPVELLNVPEGEPRVLQQPFLEALAREQTLLEQDGLELTLLGLGFYPGLPGADAASPMAELTVFYRIDNRSRQSHSLALPALCLNGAELSTSGNPFRELLELEPGQSCYYKQSLSRRSVLQLNPSHSYPSSESELVLMDSISSASALLVLDDRGIWLPIRLDEAGSGESLGPQGEPIYEDETWRVYRDPLGDQDPEADYYWIENRTDRVLSFTLRGGEQYLGSDLIGPGGFCFLGVKKPSDETPYQDLTLRWYTWEEELAYFKTYLREKPASTGPFPMEAKGGSEA